jgi:tetratricopeptide (TPR) repeat protein
MKIFLSFFALFIVFSIPTIALAFTNNDSFTKEDTTRISKLLKQGFSMRLSNPTQTIEIGRKAFEASKRIDYTYGMGEALRVIGIGHSYMGHSKDAINSYLSALTNFTKINDFISQAKIYNNIGNLYTDVDAKHAILFFNKAMPIAKKLSNKRLIATISLNLGNAFFKLNDFDLSLKYLYKSLDLFKYLKDTSSQIICKQDIGVNYFNLKKYDKAYSILIETHEMALDLDLKRIVASIDITLAEYFIRKNKFEKADAIISEGLGLASKLKTGEFDYSFKYLSYILALKLNRYKEALANLDILYKRDSLAHDNGISTQIDLIREQAKADERKRENEILLQKQKLNQVELLASAAVTILLLISIGLLYTNLKRKGKTNFQLNALNKEVIKQKQIADQINQHLEEIVFERTKELQSKNTKLKNYSSYLSHQIRGPISSLIGLLNIEKGGLMGKPECIDMMNIAVNDIDKVIQEINQMLNDDYELDLVL